MKITEEEKGWLAIMRLNKLFQKDVYIDKRFNLGKIAIHISWKSSNNLWGRFGGGWNWHLGVQWSENTIIIFLLIMCIRISRVKRNDQ